MGLWGTYWVIFRNNGKEDGNDHNGLYRDYCKDPFLYKVWQVAWVFEGGLWVPFGPGDGDVKCCSGPWRGFGQPSLVTIGFFIKWLP